MKVGSVSIGVTQWDKTAMPLANKLESIRPASGVAPETPVEIPSSRQDLFGKLEGKNFHKITNAEIIDIANSLHENGIISTEVHLNLCLPFSPIRLLNADPSINVNSELSEQASPIDAMAVFEERIGKYNSNASEVAAVDPSVRSLDAETLNVLSQLQDWINTGKGGRPIDDKV